MRQRELRRPDLQRQRQAPSFRRAVAEMAEQHPNVRLFDPMTLLCSGVRCAWYRLRDANHLSRAGSVALARPMSMQAGALKAPRTRFGSTGANARRLQSVRWTQVLRRSSTAGLVCSTKVIDWIRIGTESG